MNGETDSLSRERERERQEQTVIVIRNNVNKDGRCMSIDKQMKFSLFLAPASNKIVYVLDFDTELYLIIIIIRSRARFLSVNSGLPTC